MAKAIVRRITSQLSKVARGCEPEYARLRLKFVDELLAVLFAVELAVVAEVALPYSTANHVWRRLRVCRYLKRIIMRKIQLPHRLIMTEGTVSDCAPFVRPDIGALYVHCALAMMK